MAELLAATIKRSFCTRFIETLSLLIEQATSDNDKIAEARTQYEQLPERVREFENYHVQIMIHKDNAAKQDELLIEYDEFSSTVRKIMTAFKNPPFCMSRNNTSTHSDGLNTAFNSQISSQSQSFARLPKLDLPSFSGEIANWNSFYDLFNSSIHGNDSLQPVQKFQYLKSLLKGEPLALVKNLSLTDDNYPTARQLLENRYANKRLISSHHLQTLIDLPKPIPLNYKTATKFVSLIHEHTEALKSNHEPVDSWNPVIAFILVSKLDVDTRNQFERTLNKDNLPSLSQLLSFLDKFIQSQQWQSIHNTRPLLHDNNNALSSPRPHKQQTQNVIKTTSYISTTNVIKCAICSQPHSLFKCSEFHKMEPSARLNVVRANNCCRNCLSPFHNTKRCQSKINCKICNKRHHTLLHLNQTESTTSEIAIPSSPVDNSNLNRNAINVSSSPEADAEISLFSQNRSNPFGLLGTAVVLVTDSVGNWQSVRALLDSGSESSYITNDCMNRLNLTTHPAHITVTGFGNTTPSSIIQGTANLRLRSTHQAHPIYNLSTIVVSHIIRNLPKAQLASDILNQFKHLQLADPDFITPAPIELLLGADMYFNIITGRKTNSSIGPIALETTLGWIVSGPVGIPNSLQVNTLLTLENSISETSTKSRELEEIPKIHASCIEDCPAEDIFTQQHVHLSSGRYVIPQLLKPHPINSENSHTKGTRCFQTLQRRSVSDKTPNQECQQFMRNYLSHNHLSILPQELENPNQGFYLPHRGLLQEINSTTELKVAFNRSKRTPIKPSRNKNLLTGSALQADQTTIIQSQLTELSALQITRHIDIDVTLIMTRFCDESEAGYAAVVCIRSDYSDSIHPQTFPITAKTKVAPTKRISLPHLELCAALLLSRLISHLLKTLQIEFSEILAWSDSTIALSWIRAPPYKWKTFVSNRVAEIQNHLPQENWHHIRSPDNPADCASRGISADELLTHPLWFDGPPWLRNPRHTWPLTQHIHHTSPDPTALTEEKVTVIAENIQDDSLINKYSDLNTLLRITARCFRFFNRMRRSENTSSSFLTASELEDALLRWVKIVQLEVFHQEITQISHGKLCPKPIQNLNPFLDPDGLLRVGGRIRNSNLNYNQKHPLLLPSHHRFTHLVIEHFHKMYLHPSPRTLQAILNRKFWILAARRIIRSYSAKCIKCFRCNPAPPHPQMGDLPANRVVQFKPFDVVGVDYGGPFHVTPYKRKGFQSIKAYLCLFVCFSTKALHLELASDLSTDAFILAFRRFLARRGRCTHIYSDSGTNFVGAKSYFTDLQKFVTSSGYNEYLANHLASSGTQWHLNPPSAPHFGGLWEAGIKSVKFHLSRVIGSQILTFDEFNTLLCQIESILNSRPLSPLSADPNDLHALTPNHFIILEAAVCLPDKDYLNESEHHLNRWQLLQKTQQEFWKRWHHEYINTLQQRMKWTRLTPNLEPNQLVLIKNELLPPLQWKLGRILDVHPGRDGVVRVANVKTASGILSRPIVKLCPLPHP